VAFEFPDPALGDVVDRHRVEVVQFLSALLHGGDQIGLLQDPQVLTDRLPRHLEAHAEFIQRLAVLRAEPIEQFPAAGIGQGFEDFIHTDNMQPFGCLSRTKFVTNACPSCGVERTCVRSRLVPGRAPPASHSVCIVQAGRVRASKSDYGARVRLRHKADISKALN